MPWRFWLGGRRQAADAALASLKDQPEVCHVGGLRLRQTRWCVASLSTEQGMHETIKPEGSAPWVV